MWVIAQLTHRSSGLISNLKTLSVCSELAACPAEVSSWAMLPMNRNQFK